MTQTNNNWFNQNEVVINLALAIDVPKHRVYVDVLGNGGAFLVQKPKSNVEVFNDMNNELLTFLLAARSSNVQMLSEEAVLRLRNTMIECVEVERLFSIYDGPETLFYLDFVHKQMPEEIQEDILKQVTTLKGHVMILLPMDKYLSKWHHVQVGKNIHGLTNFKCEQLSLFAV